MPSSPSDPPPYSASEDPTTLATPPACIADFCLIPLGTATASVAREVAAVQRLLGKSGLSYQMHSAGTTVEGSWDDVMRAIGQCHALLHQNGVVRIQSDIRVGSRTDKTQRFRDKVEAVEKLLEGGE
ncbi:YkoF-like protein [Massariosphaeria phaeospora]|uniref:YkoF-like protein n=1 Tax=Massariosphaeria phaeospora TaxID=100035 RepID=A0A7C8M3J1_9PLEO|nr:YkoF-like protein [Massariosphaeria phaeospora]